MWAKGIQKNKMICSSVKGTIPLGFGPSSVWYHSLGAQSVSSTPWSCNPAQTWISPILDSSFSSHKFSFPEDFKVPINEYISTIFKAPFFQIYLQKEKYKKHGTSLTLSWMVSSLSTISLWSPWISFFIFSFSLFSLDTSDLNLLISSLCSSISRCWLINYKPQNSNHQF